MAISRSVSAFLVPTVFAIILLFACPVSAYSRSGTLGVTCNGVNGGTPTVSSSNGKVQHPEIVLIFWQDSPAEQWTNGNGGNGNPTMTQLVGDSLALANSSFYGTLVNYSGSGLIAMPRVAATVPLVTGSSGLPSGATTSNFDETDIITIVNNEVAAGAIPPANDDDTVYVVFVPANSSAPEQGNDGCKGDFGCNFGCLINGNNGANSECVYVTSNAGSGGGSATFGHETVEAISAYEGIQVSNCTYNQPGNPIANQIVDICGFTENWGSGSSAYSIPAYYDAIVTGGCVIPESWGALYSNTNNGRGWFEGTGGFNMRQAYGGAGGVVATGTDENVYFYVSNNKRWDGLLNINTGVYDDTIIGTTPAAELAAGGNNLAEIPLDVSQGVNYYDLTAGVWTSLHAPPTTPTGVTSVAISVDGWIVATDMNGSPWEWDWNASPSAKWVSIGGPADEFMASGQYMIALLMQRNEVVYSPYNSETGFSSTWSDLVSGVGAMTGMTASPDAPWGYYGTWGVTFAGTEEFLSSASLSYTNGFRTYAVTGASYNGSNINDIALDNGAETYSCYGSDCQTGDWSHTWAYGGRLISGGEMFVTGCPAAAPPCVDYTAVPPP